ncbi:hypothetical protein AUJ83_01790 [Candidatus Woesearchaeota archaeon CG1_02_33_12]|nr:MAG: hypothetical protein AUJ83_01790 [Candidatus Woesearchaeota archaeon CG1_02_33_12]PIN78737.1 MAG: hypothetical protein COV14_02275 [Candidatus Woesearchaeota archaeon CG10_big_fil_rev_8_21_14_0_10_33_12]PIU72783.1 MAG: hypothetical protein COS79_01190 [Candidatus Woesearchaeota archaeon CG06_land_8_20_14_3_00_33_13]
MEKDSLEYNTLKGKISQILLKNKAIYGASEGYSILSGEKKCSNPLIREKLNREKLKSLGFIVSEKSMEFTPKIYNRDSEFIIDHSDKIDNINQLENMIYEHCRSVGWSHNENGFIVCNLVPERTYKEGKYKKIAEEIFPLIAAYKSY